MEFIWLTEREILGLGFFSSAFGGLCLAVFGLGVLWYANGCEMKIGGCGIWGFDGVEEGGIFVGWAFIEGYLVWYWLSFVVTRL